MFESKTKGVETMDDLGTVPFVDLAKQLLDASIDSSNVMTSEPYTPETAKYAKLTLGYANAFLKAYNTKMNYWKMSGVADKVKAIKGINKK